MDGSVQLTEVKKATERTTDPNAALAGEWPPPPPPPPPSPAVAAQTTMAAIIYFARGSHYRLPTVQQGRRVAADPQCPNTVVGGWGNLGKSENREIQISRGRESPEVDNEIRRPV